MPELTFGTSQVSYEIVRSAKRTTIGIEVAQDSRIIVRAPSSIDGSYLLDVVRGKVPWILARLAKVKRISQTRSRKEFVSGESFSYLGRNYRLKVAENGNEIPCIEMRSGRLCAGIPTDLDSSSRKKAVRESLLAWYEQHAKDILNRKLSDYSKKIGVDPSRVVIKNQTKRWGSCSSTGCVSLNWRIVMAPNSVVDYVVAHELCHLKVHDHSKYFWQLLGAILPDYEKRREWLRFNGGTLEF